MPFSGGATVLLVLLALAGAAGAASKAPAPAPAVDCTTAFLGLADCLDFVQPGSTASRPSRVCCGEVKSAVDNPAVVDCLCAAFANVKSLPIPINITRVLALPDACGASSASAFAKCHIVPGPGAAPTEAPAPSPSSGGSATAAPPKPGAAARTPVSAATIVAAVAAPLLVLYYM